MGGLSSAARVEDVRELLTAFGQVVRVDVRRHRRFGRDSDQVAPDSECFSNFAFADFTCIQDALRAIHELNNTLFFGNVIHVSTARRRGDSPPESAPGRNNLFVRHLPPLCTRERLFTAFATFGRVIGCRVKVLRRARRSGSRARLRAKGEASVVGFVRMESEDQATAAIAALNGRPFPAESNEESKESAVIEVDFAHDHHTRQMDELSDDEESFPEPVCAVPPLVWPVVYSLEAGMWLVPWPFVVPYPHPAQLLLPGPAPAASYEGGHGELETPRQDDQPPQG